MTGKKSGKPPVTETMQKETQQPEKDHKNQKKIKKKKKGTRKQGNGEGDTQETTPPIGEKRKEHPKERSTHKHKKRKSFKEVAIQALTEDDLEKIRDQVKEVTEEAFM
jgi:hypothetical protein